MLIDDKCNIVKKLNLPDYYDILGKEQLKGKEIYICAQANEEGYCIFTIRDFDRMNFYPKINLIYCENEESNTVKIADILTGTYTNMGYGSILIKYVLEYLNQRKDIKKINGALVEIDRDHFDRLEHFYKKHGFNVKFKEDENGKRINGKIEKLIN